eukprot:gene12205-biopygen7921
MWGDSRSLGAEWRKPRGGEARGGKARGGKAHGGEARGGEARGGKARVGEARGGKHMQGCLRSCWGIRGAWGRSGVQRCTAHVHTHSDFMLENNRESDTGTPAHLKTCGIHTPMTLLSISRGSPAITPLAERCPALQRTTSIPRKGRDPAHRVVHKSGTPQGETAAGADRTRGAR